MGTLTAARCLPLSVESIEGPKEVDTQDAKRENGYVTAGLEAERDPGNAEKKIIRYLGRIKGFGLKKWGISRPTHCIYGEI